MKFEINSIGLDHLPDKDHAGQPLQGIPEPVHGGMDIDLRASRRVVPQKALQRHNVHLLVIEMRRPASSAG